VSASESEYTWNDFVVIKKEVSLELHPGKIAVVCGMSKIECEKTAKEYQSQLGDWVYTVEFGDGSDIQIAGCFLEKHEEV
jgi:hypothetical protein